MENELWGYGIILFTTQNSDQQWVKQAKGTNEAVLSLGNRNRKPDHPLAMSSFLPLPQWSLITSVFPSLQETGSHVLQTWLWLCDLQLLIPPASASQVLGPQTRAMPSQLFLISVHPWFHKPISKRFV